MPASTPRFVRYMDCVAVCMKCGHVINAQRLSGTLRCASCRIVTYDLTRCNIDKPAPPEIAKCVIHRKKQYLGTPEYDKQRNMDLAKADYEVICKRYEKACAGTKVAHSQWSFKCIHCDKWFLLCRKSQKRAKCPHCGLGQNVAWHIERFKCLTDV